MLPSHENEVDLCDEFSHFFHSKIKNIREMLQNQNPAHSSAIFRADVEFSGSLLESFEPVTVDEVRKIINQSAPKSCELDPVPTWLLKESLQSTVQCISNIINKSFSESVVPVPFKQAIVRPLLKKPGLDRETLKNYRPVSNLPFISKVLEKAVASRIEQHLERNSLHDNLQSAYRRYHSTETALLRVHHDIVSELDRNCCAALVMLDLSAAFDVIDHDILFQRFEHTFGITGSVLTWFKSYFSGRSQRVAIGSSTSDSQTLNIGVPQGSVLGPKTYCMFTLPVTVICRRHQMMYHCYADDTQIYIVIDPLIDRDDAIGRLKTCVLDIRELDEREYAQIKQR